nr:chloride channel protein [Francisella persica]
MKATNFFSEGPRKRYWTLVVIVCIIFGIGVVVSPNAIGSCYICYRNNLNYNLSINMLLVIFDLHFAGIIFSYNIGVTDEIFAPMIALGTVF